MAACSPRCFGLRGRTDLVLYEALADGVRFERTELSLCGFRGRRLHPLGQPSKWCWRRESNPQRTGLKPVVYANSTTPALVTEVGFEPTGNGT